METRQGAAEAPASVGRTRALIGWAGYPAWYSLVMAGVLALAPTKVRGVEEKGHGSLPVRDGVLVAGPPLAAILAATLAGAFTSHVLRRGRATAA